MKTVLFMHGGSGNHGCEALVRTSAKLLGGPENVVLWSWAKAEDQKYGASDRVERIVESEEMRRFSPAYFEALVKRRVFKQENANMQVFLKHLFKSNVAVSIGGDNYCYPWSAKQAAELDREIRKSCRHSVLWGCSIDQEALTPEVAQDLKAFDLITARESLTYELLSKINPNTVQVTDPAFLLEREDLPLPENFAEGNTVGINVSPLILKYGTDGSLILQNYEELICDILENTDMSVCLIPHVVWADNDDRKPLELLYKKFQASGRISMVPDGNCCQLKGYIARCRFFVGARTHATIAAYSSCVPTLVTGYSIKAKGIAKDLFGTYENLVIPVQEMTARAELAAAFRWLMANEESVRGRLVDIMPSYLDKAAAALPILYSMKA